MTLSALCAATIKSFGLRVAHIKINYRSIFIGWIVSVFSLTFLLIIFT